MTANRLRKRYFEWLCNKVGGEHRYNRLLTHLFERDFVYTIGLDGNRADDGMNLRYVFGDEMHIAQPEIASSIDICQCSMLEMMVALSVRCEEHIMSNPELGDRTGNWFWGMIKNLGMHTLSDSAFESEKADGIIDRLLNHKYSPTGVGGLFTVKCGHDLRTTEIWYQMCWYLDTIV